MALFKKIRRTKPESLDSINKDVLPEPTRFSPRQRIMRFYNTPRIIGRMSVVGEKESKGPVGKYFSTTSSAKRPSSAPKFACSTPPCAARYAMRGSK